MRIVPCQCPDCGRDLTGLDNDRVFVCSTCALALHFLHEGDMLRYPVRFAKTLEKNRESIMYMPFWMYRVKLDLSCKDNRKLKNALRTAPQTVYLNAFKMHGFSLYGNPGLSLTALQPTLIWEDNPQFMAGCRRTEASAKNSLSHVILAVIDRHEDVTGLDMSLEIEETTLIGVPFLDQQDKLRDAVTGGEYLSLAFDDLALYRSLRRRLNRR